MLCFITVGQKHREQINELTSYIDGSMIYGSSLRRCNELRLGSMGRLRVSENNILPIDRPGTDCELPDRNHPDRRCFAAGKVLYSLFIMLLVLAALKWSFRNVHLFLSFVDWSCTTLIYSMFLGEMRPNENMGITSVHVIFVREHNRIADILYHKYKSQHKYGSEDRYDEVVFQETRRIIVALIQVRLSS